MAFNGFANYFTLRGKQLVFIVGKQLEGVGQGSAGMRSDDFRRAIPEVLAELTQMRHGYGIALVQFQH